MITPRDVSAEKLIPVLVEELKKTENIKPPPSASFVKSGVHVERPPQQEYFWFIRSASIMRKLYLNVKPVGVQRLRTVFGGKRNRGHKRSHKRKAGGKFIRLMLQQLEKEVLIIKTRKPLRGRIIAQKGQKLHNSHAKQDAA